MKDSLFSFEFSENEKSPFESFKSSINEYKNKLKCYLLEKQDCFHKGFSQENSIVKDNQEKEKEIYKELISSHSKKIFNEDFIAKLEFEQLRNNFSTYKKDFDLYKFFSNNSCSVFLNKEYFSGNFSFNKQNELENELNNLIDKIKKIEEKLLKHQATFESQVSKKLNSLIDNIKGIEEKFLKHQATFKSQVSKKLNSLTDNIKEIEEKLQNHREKITQGIKFTFKEKLRKIKDLDLLVKENNLEDYFNRNLYLTFTFLFSKKIKKIKLSKKEFIKNYFNLKNSHPNLFNFEFLENEKSPLESFKSNISEYEGKLEEHLILLERQDCFHKDFNPENPIIKRFRETLLKEFKQFKEFHLKDNLFSFEFLENEKSPLESFKSSINEYKNKLEQCYLLEKQDYFHKDFNQGNSIIKKFREILLKEFKQFKEFHLKDNLYKVEFLNKSLIS